MVEVTIAMAVLTIIALGALGYQYHATRQARVAHGQMTATRIGLLLLEDWKSTGGSEDYDPVFADLGFETTQCAASDFGFGEGLGTALRNTVYGITIDDVPMHIVLKYKDVDTDEVAQITLRQIAVVLKFDEPGGQSGTLAAYNPAISLSTHVRLDASGG